MAQMIAVSSLSRASEGEKKLFKVLEERLPNDFIVWYEPRVKGLHPDFIILGQDFGLLVIEVKGWSVNQIKEISGEFFHIERNGRERLESEQSPLNQGKGYTNAVLDKIKEELILTHHKGKYQGKPVFPTSFGAVMSNITMSQAHNRDIYKHLEQPQVAYKDELLAWEDFSEEKLIQRLKAMFPDHLRFPFNRLTDDQISTIRGVVHPETKIKRVEADEKSVPEGVELLPGSSVIVTLDLDQEKLARNLGGGHRLISGVAGSGKTLILLARAKVIANRLTEHRVLILCFNITLAAHLRSLLHSDSQNPQYKERIDVMHFNAWAKSINGRLPNPEEFGSSYDQILGEKVLATLQQFSLEHRWDSVLVDEAHTFDPSWFSCCVEALKDRQNGDLLIISDRNQSLYPRPPFTWSSVGVKARGRSKNLNQNYRNTQEILSAAWSIVESISGEAAINEDATFPVVKPNAALRQGAKPVLHVARLKEEAINALIQQVKLFAESGYAPGEIAILYRKYTHKNSDLFTEMLVRLNQLGLRTYWITENDTTKRDYDVSKPGIRILTSLSSLGLEFKVILLLWLEQFADSCNSNVEEAAMARRQLYVAMTRAQDELHLFGSGNTKILQELQQGGSFKIVQE